MEEKQEHWAIVELMGHQRMAGLVSEHTLGGTFVRVDVPGDDGTVEFTRLLGPSAIYAINFVSEDIARRAARSFQYRPVSKYDLPALGFDGEHPHRHEDLDPEDPDDDY